jgi:hypothetical protein
MIDVTRGGEPGGNRAFVPPRPRSRTAERIARFLWRPGCSLPGASKGAAQFVPRVNRWLDPRGELA